MHFLQNEKAVREKKKTLWTRILHKAAFFRLSSTKEKEKKTEFLQEEKKETVKCTEVCPSDKLVASFEYIWDT